MHRSQVASRIALHTARRPVIVDHAPATHLTSRWPSRPVKTTKSGTDVAPDAAQTALDDNNPYPALTPFGIADNADFHGRDELSRRLYIRTVAGRGLLAVVGPPGSGITSLLQAGLAARVAADGLNATTRSRNVADAIATTSTDSARLSDGPDGDRAQSRLSAGITIVSPGADPSAALRNALGSHAPHDEVDAHAWADALVAAGAEHSGPDAAPPTGHLLVVDRFDDLFTLCRDDERATFVRLLRDIARDDRCAVVIAINAEFYSRAVVDGGLADALDGRTLFVTPIDDADVTEAIVNPARRRDVRVEPELVDAIVTDLADPPLRDQRAILLGIALDRLWRNRTGDVLTLDAYRADGAISTAVADTAENWWSQLAPADHPVAQALITSTLVLTRDGHVVWTRRRVADLLAEHAAHRRAPAVLDTLLKVGLLRSTVVVDRGETARTDRTVGLRHEFLITGWPRLREWIDLRRNADPLTETVEADARAWKAAGRPNRALYSADKVAEVDRVVEAGATLSGDARDFMAQCHGHLVTGRRSRRGLVAAGAIAAVVAVVVGVTVAVDSGDDSDGATNGLDATLARVTALQGTDDTAAAQLALTTFRDNPDDADARAALLNTQSAGLYRPLGGNRAPTATVARAGKADRAAFLNADGSVSVWSTGGTAPVLTATVPASHDGQTSAIALNSTGTRLATTGADGTVELFTLSGTGTATPLATVPGRAGSPTGAVAFATDRPWVAASDSTGAVRVWDISDPRRPTALATLRDGSAAVRSIAFSPTAPVLALGGDNRRLSVWGLSDPDSPERISGSDTGNAALRSITFSDNGSLAATSDEVGNSQLWTVGDDGVSAVGPVLPPTNSGESSAVFSPNATRLAVSSSTGSVQIWDVSRPSVPRPLGSPMRDGGVAVTDSVFRGENQLLSATDRGPALWSLPAGLLTGGFGTSTDPSCSIARSACATGFLRGPVHVIDTTSTTAPAQIGMIDAPSHFDGASMSPDGLWMTTVDARHVMQLWDVKNLRAPIAVGPPIQLGPQQRNHLVFSPSSGLLATGIDGATSVRVWRVTNRGLTSVGTVLGDSTQVDSIAFAPDSSRIAVGGRDGSIRQWTVGANALNPAGRDIAVGAPVESVAYSGSSVISGDARGGLNRFDAVRGTRTGEPVSFGASPVLSVAPYGDGVVAAGADGTIRTWDADGRLSRIGNPLGTSAPGDVHLTPSTNGTMMVTGAQGLQQLWSPDTAAAAARICSAGPTPVGADPVDVTCS